MTFVQLDTSATWHLCDLSHHYFKNSKMGVPFLQLENWPKLCIKIQSLKDFEGWVCCAVHGCDPSQGGQDTGVGGIVPASQTVWSLRRNSLSKRRLLVKKGERCSSFVLNLVKFQATKMANPILESSKWGVSSCTNVSLLKCLLAQTALHPF